MKIIHLSFFTIFILLFSANNLAEAQMYSPSSHDKSLFNLAGYADINYLSTSHNPSSFAAGRFAPIFQFFYDQFALLGSELEFTYDEKGELEVGVEYLTISLLLNDYFALVVGKFLSPIGQFRQNLHPSWINKLPSAPKGFGHGGAVPLAEVGAEVRGGFSFKNDQMGLNYALYVGNGPQLKDEGDEIEIMTSGFSADNNPNKVIGGRLGFIPHPELEIGGSYVGGKVRNNTIGDQKDRDYSTLNFDFVYKPNFLVGLFVRGEFARTNLGEGGTIDPTTKELTSWYVQASYIFSSVKLEPVFRYGINSKKDDNVTTNKLNQAVIGLNYLFYNNVIAKVAYEFNSNTEKTDEDQYHLQLAFGF